MIDPNILKQITELVDWVISLPRRLADGVMGPQLAYLEAKETTAKLKELKALRDVGEHISELYWFKGNIYVWVNRLQAQKQVEEVEYVRDLFRFAAEQVGEVEKIMKATPLSNLTLAMEAAQTVGRAKVAFETLATLSNADILGDRGLIDIIGEMDELMSQGDFLARLADDHRQKLEGYVQG